MICSPNYQQTSCDDAPEFHRQLIIRISWLGYIVVYMLLKLQRQSFCESLSIKGIYSPNKSYFQNIVYCGQSITLEICIIAVKMKSLNVKK